MNEFFNELIKTSDDSRNIAVVSHGASIKFFLSKYCTLNDDVELVYKNNVLKIYYWFLRSEEQDYKGLWRFAELFFYKLLSGGF